MKKKMLGLLVGLVLVHGLVCAEERWPMFRGPRGDGSAMSSGLPLSWSETENVRWKTAIPHKGWCTPVVQDGQIWLTSATEKGNDFYAYCMDAETGKMIREKQLFHCDKPEPLSNSVNCYAAPSSAIEPGRVYVHFGSYGTACLDTATGKVIWKREDLPCRHYRGPGSSVIIYKDFLLVTLDGVDAQYLVALDKRTGKTVWRTDRDIEWKDLDANGKPKREGDFRKGFSTPLIIEVSGKEQLISPASTFCIAYEPATGKEIWRVGNSAHTPAVSPIYSSGLVMTATGHGQSDAEMLAIRPDGTGDLTKTHVAWRIKGKDVPTTTSSVAIGDMFYMPDNRGTLTCLETKSGKTVWRERIGGNYLASPIHNGERIYFFSTSGRAVVVQAGREFKKLAENKLDAGCMASPAVLGDSLIVRTKTHLYRIEEKTR